MTLVLVSVLLSPIVTLLVVIFARRSFLVLQTTSGTRLYASSNISPSRAQQLRSQRFPAKVGRNAVTFGGTEYRLSDWTTGPLESDNSDAATGEPLPNPEHDRVLANNRKRIVINWALIPISLAAIVAVVAFSWPYLNPPNSFTVAWQADQTYCSGNNYGKDMAVETTAGTALIIGGRSAVANEVPDLHRRSRNDTAFDDLISNRGRLKADVVLCVGGTSQCSSVQVHQTSDANDAEARPAPSSPTRKWDCAEDRDKIAAEFDAFICEAVGCRVGA